MCPGHIDFDDGHSRAAYCAHLSLEVMRGRAISQSVTLVCATGDSSETRDGRRGDDAVSIIVLQPGAQQLQLVCSSTVPRSFLFSHHFICESLPQFSLPVLFVRERWGFFNDYNLHHRKVIFNQKLSPSLLCCLTPIPRAVFEECAGCSCMFTSLEQFVPWCSASSVRHF